MKWIDNIYNYTGITPFKPVESFNLIEDFRNLIRYIL